MYPTTSIGPKVIPSGYFSLTKIFKNYLKILILGGTLFYAKLKAEEKMFVLEYDINDFDFKKTENGLIMEREDIIIKLSDEDLKKIKDLIK